MLFYEVRLYHGVRSKFGVQHEQKKRSSIKYVVLNTGFSVVKFMENREFFDCLYVIFCIDCSRKGTNGVNAQHSIPFRNAHTHKHLIRDVDRLGGSKGAIKILLFNILRKF